MERKDDPFDIDPDMEECPDFDLTEDDYEPASASDPDIIEDFWLTPDAYEILEEVQAKVD